MQQTARRVDWPRVRILLLWCCGAIALAAGQVWANVVGFSGPAIVTVACICLLITTWMLRAGHSRVGLIAAVTTLAVLHTGVASDPFSPTVGHRGADGSGRFHMLRVVGAGIPGARCRVMVAEGGADRAWLSAPPDLCPVAAGQRLLVPVGELRYLRVPELPGDPDPRDLAAARGVRRLLESDRVVVASAPTSRYWTWVSGTRQAAWESTRFDDAAGFVAASTLGLRTALSPRRREQLRAAGIGHLVAVSGMHVAVVAWLARSVVLRGGLVLGSSLTIGVLLSLVPVAAYVGLTGGSASSVRAASMLALASLGTVVGRPIHGLHILAVTCVAMLIARPGWALDPGFQLSVAALAVIVRAPPRAGLLQQSWRVTWAVAPLATLHFGDAPFWGVITNLVAIAVFSYWILPLGIAGWLLVPIVGPAAVQPASWGAGVLLDVAAVIAGLPDPSPHVAAVVAAAFAVLHLPAAHTLPPWLRRLRPPLLACLGMLAVVGVRPVAEAPSTAVYVVGKARDLGIMTVDQREGCLSRVPLPPHRVQRLLAKLAVDRARIATDAKPSPRIAALLRNLAADGRDPGRGPPACGRDPTDAERRAHRRCRRLLGGGLAIVRHTGHRGFACFTGEDWRPIVL